MRAILLEGNPRFTPLLVSACDVVGMPLARITELFDLLALTVTARRRDVVVLDCSLEQRADVDRYAAVLRESTVPVLVIYTTEIFRQTMQVSGRTPAAWLLANIGWLDLLDWLETQQYRAHRRCIEGAHWSPTGRQRAVLALIGESRSQAQIATALQMQPGTVKTHVRRLMDKFDVSTVEELRAIHRLMVRRQAGHPARDVAARREPG